MIDSQQLADAFALNLRIIRMQTDSLTHEDSLLQPPFRGNCLNWVLGHILANRSRVLQSLGEDGVLDDDALARYEIRSAPIAGDGEGVLPLETLLEALERSQQGIAAGLQRATREDLAQEVERGGRAVTLGQALFGLYFHETYHTGQLELLRQLAGTDDKVI